MYGAFKVDHYFRLQDSKITQFKYAQDFKTAIKKRLEKKPASDKKLVVVAASGGGIQASGWTAQVLAGLQDEKLGIGEDFTKAIGLISSVSGGSVATMFYLDQFEKGILSEEALKEYSPEGKECLSEEKASEEKECLAKVVLNATDDWLDSVGWGFAFPDLLRLIGFPWGTKWGYLDRGYALEKDWQRTLEKDYWQTSLENPNKTLDDWYDKAIAGEIPIPVFNSTLVENGRRFFISPMKFIPEEMKYYLNDLSDTELSKETKQKIRESKALDFRTLYNCGTPENPKACNLDVVTAARLSATFPYVSPTARNYIENQDNGDNLIKVDNQQDCHTADCGFFDNFIFSVKEWLAQKGWLPQWLREDDEVTKQNYHMADGGFFDNFGIFTATEWLDKFLEENADDLKIKKVVLLQINAFPELKLKPDQKGNLGFITVLTGPLKALTGVRDSTQVARNIQAVKLLKDKWNNNGKGISIEYFSISFPEKYQEDNEEQTYSQPLSWRLTQTQKYNLKNAWEDPKGIIRDEVKCMNFFWFYDHSELNDLKDTEKITKIQADLVEKRYLLGGFKEIDGIVVDKTLNDFDKLNAFTKFNDTYSNSTIEEIEQEFNKCEWVADKP